MYSNQALVNEDSNRSMVFTGSSRALSYVDGASVPNTLWADSLEADLDNKDLMPAVTAFGQCEGDLYNVKNLLY